MAIEELKQEATELGITFSQNIGEAKLQEKIDAYYASQETSGAELLKAIEAKEQTEEKSAVASNKVKEKQLSKQARIKEIEAAAKKTRVIKIIDNDQRVNNQTTAAVVNCTNEHFDLGTVVLPLNIPVEVRQGHINVLKEVEIPLHSLNPKTGLSTYSVRNRYTISYED